MSTSDSDYSIDWLASDEEDDGHSSPKRLSPQRADESPPPPPPSSSSSSSSSSSLRESPTSCFHSQRKRRRRRRSDHRGCKDGGGRGVDAESPAAARTSAVGPVRGSSPASEHLSAESKRRSSGTRKDCEEAPADTEHRLFSQKSAELQRYVQPLSSILQGLRSGRYSERLSSFQESVAMDRIQRIMGVLQNPNTGGRFLSILLKIEEMLHSWFPHIRPDQTQTDGGTPATKQKRHGGASSSPPSSRRLQAAPICVLKTPEPTPGRLAACSSAPPARRSQEVTQDSAVSSSTDSRSGPQRRLGRPLPPFKIRSPCLERLLQATESIIAPRTAGDGGWSS